MKKIGIVSNGNGHGMPEVYAWIIVILAVIGAYFLYSLTQKRNNISQNLY